MGITRFLKNKQTNKPQQKANNNKTGCISVSKRGRSGFLPASRSPGPARTLAVPARRLPASRASFCVQRLLPATRTPGHTVATRNRSQYPLKFSKAPQPRLHSRRHPTGKRQRRHRSFRHSVFPRALWVFLRATLTGRTSHREPLGPRRSARSRSWGRGQHRARVPRSRRSDSGLSGLCLLDGMARPRASRGLVARGRAGRRRRL